MMDSELQRQINHMASSEVLQALEKPFTFYERDKARAAQREAMVRAAKDPNRFQRSFRANPIPESTRDERYKHMMAALEEKRNQWRQRAEATAEAVKLRTAEAAARRSASAGRAYTERLRTVDPVYNQKYDTTPLGAVPDFSKLHGEWTMRLAAAKAANRQRVTVPQEFRCAVA